MKRITPRFGVAASPVDLSGLVTREAFDAKAKDLSEAIALTDKAVIANTASDEEVLAFRNRLAERLEGELDVIKGINERLDGHDADLDEVERTFASQEAKGQLVRV